MAQTSQTLRHAFKSVANGLAGVLVFGAAVTCWLENAGRGGREGVFNFWTHVLALAPGLPGVYLRRAFYRLTLDKCSARSAVGFGAFFTHRQVQVEDDVYVGPYAVVGRARLLAGSLIGTRANLLSGSAQHVMAEDGSWQPADVSRFEEIEIGPHAWIGEASTIMASVGRGSVVSAGAVVSAPVPPGVVVAGNPARFVRKSEPTPALSTPPVTTPEGQHESLVHSLH